MVEIVFLIFGGTLLAVSAWGWIGFIMTVKMRESFNITTPSEFLSMSIMGLGFLLIYWLWWLGLLLVFMGFIAGFILQRILGSIMKRRYASMSSEEMKDLGYKIWRDLTHKGE